MLPNRDQQIAKPHLLLETLSGYLTKILFDFRALESGVELEETYRQRITESNRTPEQKLEVINTVIAFYKQITPVQKFVFNALLKKLFEDKKNEIEKLLRDANSLTDFITEKKFVDALDKIAAELADEAADNYVKPKIEHQLLNIHSRIQQVIKEKNVKQNNLPHLLLPIFVEKHSLYLSLEENQPPLAEENRDISTLIEHLVECANLDFLSKKEKSHIWYTINLIMANKTLFKKKNDQGSYITDSNTYAHVCGTLNSRLKQSFRTAIQTFRIKNNIKPSNQPFSLWDTTEELLAEIPSFGGSDISIFNAYISKIDENVSIAKGADNLSKQQRKFISFLKDQKVTFINQLLNPNDETPLFYYDPFEENKQNKEIIETMVSNHLIHYTEAKLTAYQEKRENSLIYKLKDQYSDISKCNRMDMARKLIQSAHKITTDGKYNFVVFFDEINTQINTIKKNITWYNDEIGDANSSYLAMAKKIRRQAFAVLVLINKRYGSFTNELEEARESINRSYDESLKKRLDDYTSKNDFQFAAWYATFGKHRRANRDTHINNIFNALNKHSETNKKKSETAYYTDLVEIIKNEIDSIAAQNKRHSSINVLREMQYDIIQRFILKETSNYKLNFTHTELNQLLVNVINPEQKKKLLEHYQALKAKDSSPTPAVAESYLDKKNNRDMSQQAILTQYKTLQQRVENELTIFESRLKAGDAFSKAELDRYHYLRQKNEILKDDNLLTIYRECKRTVGGLILAGNIVPWVQFKQGEAAKNISMLAPVTNLIPNETAASALNAALEQVAKFAQKQHEATIRSLAELTDDLNDIDAFADNVALLLTTQYAANANLKKLDALSIKDLAAATAKRIEEALMHLKSLKQEHRDKVTHDVLIIYLVNYVHMSRTKHGFALFEQTIRKPDDVAMAAEKNSLTNQSMTVDGFFGRTGVYVVDDAGQTKFYLPSRANVALYGFRKGTQEEVEKQSFPECTEGLINSSYPLNADQNRIKEYKKDIEAQEARLASVTYKNENRTLASLYALAKTSNDKHMDTNNVSTLFAKVGDLEKRLQSLEANQSQPKKIASPMSLRRTLG